MTIDRNTLVTYLNQYLNIAQIRDYGPQGLQVESDQTSIGRIAIAVDTAPPIIEAAAEWGADMLLVHHGIFWGKTERIAGPLGRRVRGLLSNNINLYAAHLPLDAHAEVGNNAVMARMFGLETVDFWGDFMGTKLGVVGDLATPTTLESLVASINSQLDTTARVLANGSAEVRRLAILSGGGASKVAAARALGADTYLTGETSHADYWMSADEGINVIFAGHYASETVGVRALGEHLVERYGVETKFFDFPTHM